MEILLAKKILEMSESELIAVLMALKLSDHDAYLLLKDKVEDVL